MANQSQTKQAGNSVERDPQYVIDSHTYPMDLTNNPKYGGNFVMFYINVTEDSKLGRDSNTQTVSSDQVPKRDRGDLVGKGFTKNQAIVGGGIGGGIAGTALGSALGIGGGAGGLTGTALGAGGAAIIPGPSVLSRPTKRLKTAIALYMPSQLNIRYGVQYEEENMATAQMLLKGGQGLVQAATGNLGKAADSLGSLKDALAGVAISQNLGGVGSAVGVGSGLAANPKKEQVFKGVDFRSFQINYQFFPRDNTEAQKVRNIIHAFKYHMHPEFKDEDGFLYIYPSEFDIVYYSGNQENFNLHKHTSCVLKDMNINYTPQGQFNSLENGMPLQINIDMTFLELAIVTKEKVKENADEGGL